MSGWITCVFELTARESRKWDAAWERLPDDLALEIELDFQTVRSLRLPTDFRVMLFLRFVDEGIVVGPDGSLRVPINLEPSVKKSLRDWSIKGHWRTMRRGHFKSAQAQAAWAAILSA